MRKHRAKDCKYANSAISNLVGQNGSASEIKRWMIQGRAKEGHANLLCLGLVTYSLCSLDHFTWKLWVSLASSFIEKWLCALPTERKRTELKNDSPKEDWDGRQSLWINTEVLRWILPRSRVCKQYLPPVFVNKVLLGHSQVHFLWMSMHCLWMFSCCYGRAEWVHQRQYDPQGRNTSL